MKILVKNFNTRAALEKEVENKDSTKDTIEGTREELARFNLSDRNKVHGLPVVITDTPTPKKKQNLRPERG